LGAAGLVNMTAIGYGNVMMLSCMRGTAVIFNTILSVTILGEELLMRRAFGMFIVVTGAITFIIFAKNDDKMLTREQITALYERPASVLYFIISGVVTALVYYFDYKIKS